MPALLFENLLGELLDVRVFREVLAQGVDARVDDAVGLAGFKSEDVDHQRVGALVAVEEDGGNLNIV